MMPQSEGSLWMPWAQASCISGSQDGFWIRDGDSFINVENNIDGEHI